MVSIWLTKVKGLGESSIWRKFNMKKIGPALAGPVLVKCRWFW
jgi:hypothetical protein